MQITVGLCGSFAWIYFCEFDQNLQNIIHAKLIFKKATWAFISSPQNLGILEHIFWHVSKNVLRPETMYCISYPLNNIISVRFALM